MTTKWSKSKSKARKHAVSSPLNTSVVASKETDDVGCVEEKEGKARRKASRRRGGGDVGGSGKDKRGRRAMSESKLSEEAALTERLFGGDGFGGVAFGEASPAAASVDDYVGALGASESAEDALEPEETHFSDDKVDADLLFAIDRSGEEVADVGEKGEDEEDASHDEGWGDGHEHLPLDDQGSDEEPAEEEEEKNDASSRGAAWRDSDSEDSDSDDESDEESNSDARTRKQKKGVSLVDGPNRHKKLRRYRDETDPVSIGEYERRLRERFISTASVAARTDWAEVGLARRQQEGDTGGEPQTKKKGGYASSSSEESSDDDHDRHGDDVAKNILESNASLFATSTAGRPLPPTLLDVVRSRDGNLADPNNSVVSSLQFHPGSDKDEPLLMTAGMDKMLRFFRINPDGDKGDHAKVHGIHFSKMPITCASFLGDSGSVVLSGRRPFFYVYDALSGKIQRIPSIIGRSERSLEKFTVSPDGRTIAFVGNDGYVILVDGRTRRWMGDLKMNGSVRAITFSSDSEYVLGSGSDGDVYRWHIGSRKCVERFHNEDGTITSSLAVSPRDDFLAVGAESGVVNLYNDRRAPSLTRQGGLALASADRAPLKSVMNLTTSADVLQFNHDGNVLAMLTKREKNGLKLLHVPTATVFSNWPTSKTPLKHVWSMDFSPGSRYLAVGNDRGKCLLYRLKHYWDE